MLLVFLVLLQTVLCWFQQRYLAESFLWSEPIYVDCKTNKFVCFACISKGMSELLSQRNASCPCRRHCKVIAPLLSICYTLATLLLLGSLVDVISLVVTSVRILASVLKRSSVSVMTIEYWVFSLWWACWYSASACCLNLTLMPLMGLGLLAMALSSLLFGLEVVTNYELHPRNSKEDKEWGRELRWR